jgi:hypothetical protein
MLSLASRSLSCVLRRWRASAQLLVRIAVLLNFGRIVVFMLALLFVGPAAAGQEGTDMRLEDMGFVMRPANAPEQLERLRLLPPRKFIARTKNGTRYYIYADPDYCQCVFLGNEQAMRNYNNLVSPPPQAPMVIGSGDLPPTVTQQMIEDVDPGVAIVDGDILDY